MESVYSKQRLREYLTAYVAHSTVRKKAKFTRTAIAEQVFGKVAGAKQRLGECTSHNPRPPLTAEPLYLILEAVRKLFLQQLTAIGYPDPDSEARRFEQGVCRQLSFGNGEPITVAHFEIPDELLTTQDFGVPDVYAWGEDSFDFVERLSARQRQSVHAMQQVLTRLGRCSDPCQRMQLMEVAVSIAMLNHPGSQHHDLVGDMLLQAACEAQLQYYATSQRVPEELRRTAIQLTNAVHFSRLLPTLESPTNYQIRALRGEPLSQQVAMQAQRDLWQSILAADAVFQMDRENPATAKIRSSTISFQARILAATGNAGALREADQLNKEAARDVERLGLAYGFAYPILRCLVKGQYGAAIRVCESSIDTCEQ